MLPFRAGLSALQSEDEAQGKNVQLRRAMCEEREDAGSADVVKEVSELVLEPTEQRGFKLHLANEKEMRQLVLFISTLSEDQKGNTK
ncbi:uncharacterized protein MONOS_1232 [Monocercomonoides exilis]|uniref:uncharacterized protein n=1 Tax=Monocercomonoides exilis TaxID=2049356 RepID=UPI00355AC501|nr:hypothetical protein MONOS_1232 [Monocercomonoides exilis]|eukprot:MONOS_1232.1-p1 / transcript=MONOS_1232.1 / gene=MONOS_1232 / organism=Monocercomonoides_exilis_PA203 / gene_product=unspecified product / transcript_product=unspecified product / location=Mono_scaffold00021:61076-61625(+) / protein_length=87 / sequence_SO=supercontig / SO=protein_coding / is_pseudo=false